MDWIAVFAAMGGAAAFAGTAKFVAEKVVEQVIAGRRSEKTELAKAIVANREEHRALIARTQLDVLGALLDAIYPLKTKLARLDIHAQRLDWTGVDAVVSKMDTAIGSLEENLGGKRPYIPPPFDERVHSFKNHLYGVRADLAGYLHATRGRRHLSETQSARARDHLIKLSADVDLLFGGLIVEAQHRIAGDVSDPARK